MMRSCFAFITVLSHLFGVGVHSLVSDDPVLPITLNVAIITAGLPEISTGALLATLRTSLPRYFPANEGGKPIHDIQLLLNYDLRNLQNEFLQKYEAFIEEHAADEDGYHVLFVDEVAHFLQTELEAIGSVMPNFAFPLFDTFTLPVMIIDSKNIKKHLITANADEIESCTMSLLSSVAFLDLSAKACDVTKAVSHDAAQIKWVTPDVKSPYPFTFPISKAPVYDPSIEHFNSHITSRMTGLVTSAIQAMSTGNLKWRPAHATEKIYCPIVVLRNGIAAYNEEAHPNIPALESWLQSILLPHQQVVLMTSVHYIDEHPQLSVAIAAAHMTYATTVLSGSTSHVEKIPYIDSNLLFHEMASVGDKLCDLLFHQYGNGEALRILQQELDIEESMGPRVKVGHSDLTNKKKATRSATVVPVFVIGDLHIHHNRHLAASKTGKTKVEEHFPSAVPEIPVQPLFDKDSLIAVDSDSSAVLVLHSSEDSVNTFSPHTRTWRGTSLTDLDSLIAEGLTKALTGFSAPHKQREGADLVDVTWTHGMHPFNPFGHLSYEPETYHSLFSTSIKRGILIARAHRLMQRAISIGHRSGGIEAEISDAFRYLHSLHGSSRQAGRSFAGVNSQSQTGGFKKDDKMLDTTTELPEMLLAHAKSVRQETDRLIEKVHLLRAAFKNSNTDHILEIFRSLEGSMDATESYIEDVETGMHLQLKNCHVAFDVDPHLVDQVSNRKLSQAAFDRMSMSPHSRRKDQTAFNAGHFNNLYIAATVVILITVGVVIMNVHLRMTKQLKKRM